MVKKWNEEGTDIVLGRTMIQKICYFLKAKGVPLHYKFDMYHYGPYSQELYYRMDELAVDGIVIDQFEQQSKSKYIPGDQIEELLNNHDISHYLNDIDSIIGLFNQFHPSEMELLATIHYLQTTTAKYYGKVPEKNSVIDNVINIKRDKFERNLISRAYDALQNSGLFTWNAI